MIENERAVCFAAVAVERAAFHFDQLYTYAIPPLLQGAVLPGCRVRVPFGSGGKDCVGLVLELRETAGEAHGSLKSLRILLDASPLLPPELVGLIPWLREHCFCTYYEAFRAMVPAGLHQKIHATFSALPPEHCPPEALLEEDERRILEKLRTARSRKSYHPKETLLKSCGLPVDSMLPELLAEKGFLLRNTDALRGAGELTERIFAPAEESAEAGGKLTGRQGEVWAFLAQCGAASMQEICTYTGASPAVPQAMERKGVLRSWAKRIWRGPVAENQAGEATPIALTKEQEQAFDNLRGAMQSETPGTALLFGVTGSGKTSVYLRLIDETLAQGRGVVVLVPEIALTPQLLGRFTARYGSRVALLHSALSMGERMDEWNRLREGRATIALGTRSAVFAPLENIGLIVMDEEHEHTYKSEQTPRFHARDVAKRRAAQNHALLLLASATPGVESYAAALRGRYRLETLENRYGTAALPEVRTVDLRLERRAGENRLLSGELLEELRRVLAEGHQAILLMNRRGYHTFLACDSCSRVITCPQCSISLTYHLANERVMCHYCGFSGPAPTACPECGQPTVRFGGAGTQKLEQELLRLLPGLRVARMDADSTAARGAREELLSGFAAKQYDVLLGTQMVAKGLDFENVTLVGVLSIDQQLYLDDYRSQERAFALLTQVVGRAGRGQYPGLALVQTINPENEIIRLAARQAYRSFFQTEIRLRKLLIYPPYCDFCLLGVVAELEPLARQGAKYLLELLRQRTAEDGAFAGEKIIVLGPMPARVSKLGNRFRWRLLVKCHSSAAFRRMVADVLSAFGKESRFAKVTAYADMNPETIV
ncbi:MAG: primosomal protein N' [Oscillospiraceae bacterium]|jgi:primosomal protein N' (replication factor Y)|nr:primosomal protein N' [Oscillospiraceae bacterium]